MSRIERVGIIGLGKMGRPMAKNLVSGGFRVTGYDVNRRAVKAAVASGARIGRSPADVAAKSDLVIVMVGFDSEVDRVLFGRDGVLSRARPGLVIAVCSTVAPDYMRGLPARAKGRKVTFIDAPLCRGEEAAKDGRLLIMGGGGKRAFRTCVPAFGCFADSIHHLGALGAGQTGKMVNNLILWACISANDEGLRLAGALGVEEGPLRHALLKSSAQNWALETLDEDSPMPWAEKDMTIVLHEADSARISLPLCGTLKEVIKGVKIARGQSMPRATG